MIEQRREQNRKETRECSSKPPPPAAAAETDARVRFGSLGEGRRRRVFERERRR
jgi:hypothetical protein